jgi:ferredoxin
LDKCPAGADIPQIFGRYIESKQFDDSEPFDLCYFLFIDAERTGGKCSGCGGCSNHCPQKINIPAELARIHNEVLVLFLGDNPDNIKKRISEGMKLVLFGAGKIGKNAALALLDADIVPYAFCDNREELWGSEVSGIKVIGPAALEELYAGGDVGIAVATFYRNDVRAQLKEKGMVALN